MDSQAIVNTMEVLATKPINELVTEATIKVCWVAEVQNPNFTVITKDVGRQIAATLPGAPVVGFFNEETGDFVEHSRKIEIKDGQLFCRDVTRPYGFVSFDPPWYQDFMENGVIRTYLMCKAYLWTRQYAEASLALNKGQSMELNEETMSGYYEGDVFVFTQATLDKLCILGDGYAPCFEGAKIMSTYAKQYNDFTAKVEDIIGRRYYVMNGKLEPKPDKITLEYALQLGWNLNDAVYAQLALRGGDQKYCIQGIYSDTSGIFVILQDMTSLEFVRCTLEITSQDTVVLGDDMAAVTMSWTPKTPPEPEPVQSLGGNDATPTSDPATNLSTTPAPAINTTGVFTATEPQPASEPTQEPAPEPSAEPEPAAEPASDPAAQYVAQEGETEPAAEPAQEPAPEPAAEPTSEGDPATQFAAQEGDPAAEPAEPAAEPAAEPEPASEPEPSTDFAALNAQVADLQAQLAAANEKVTALESELADYRKAEADAIDEQKAQLVATYKMMLTEDEMKPILEKMNELSLDELEAKLAVTYTRKRQQEQFTSAQQLQVNIAHIGNPDGDAGLPAFMKDALEIDKQLRGGITLKA